MSKILMYVKDWLDAQPETEQEWIGKLEELKHTERRAGWEFAKWLQWGVRQYSRSVEDIAHQVGYSPHTLANILSAMNNSAAPLAQELGLNLSHAVEVLGLPEEEKAALLTEAAEQSWSVRKLSFKVHEKRFSNLPAALSDNAIGSAPLNDNSNSVETYQSNAANGIAPVLCARAGCYERASTTDNDGIGICSDHYVTEVQGDDVPFSHVDPDPQAFWKTASALLVIEELQIMRGKKFVAELKEEVCRWW